MGWLVAARLASDPVRGSSASTSAVVGVGGLVALQVLFLQSPGFVSSQGALPFWAGVLVVLIGDSCALLAVGQASRVLVWPVGLALAGLVGLAGTALLPIVTGPAVAIVLVVVQCALCALVGVALLPQTPEPIRVHGMAGPARATGAAILALVVIFLWQFYIDTPLPFPRWAIPLVGVVAVLAAAVIAHRSQPHADQVPGLLRLVAVPTVLSLGLAVTVPAGLWVTRPNPLVTAAASPTVRVMTYNIRSGVDTTGQLRPDAIVQVIRTYDPDVVVLQEVGRGWSIHAGTDVLAYLERQLNFTAVYRAAADQQFDNVVLSRLPMTTVSTGMLPDVGGQHRSYVAVRVDVAGRPLMVLGTQLEDRSAVQIRALRGIVGTTTPAVIVGDLNLHPDEPEVTELNGLVVAALDVGDAGGQS